MKFLKKSAFAKTIVLIIFSLGINLLISAVTRLLNYTYFPLYLDNIGTVFAALLGGALPGVFVGFVTNVINSTITSELTMYYGTISVIIALLVRYFFVNGSLKTFPKRLGVSAFIGIISGLLGAGITWVIYGYSFGTEVSAPLAQKLVSDWRIYPLASQFATELFINVIDKAITIASGYLMLVICPKSIKSLFRASRQEREKISVIKRIKKFSHSFLGNVVRTMLLFEIILCIIATTICYYMYKDTNVQKFATTCMNATAVAKNEIKTEMIESFLTERQEVFDEFVEDLPSFCKWDPWSHPEYFTSFYEFAHERYSPEYIATEQALEKVASSFEDIEYLYVYKVEEDGCHVVFDVEQEEYVALVPFDSTFQALVPNLLAGEEIDPLVSDENYGWLLTYYRPIRDNDGNCLAYVCADISMDDLRVDQTIFIVKVSTVLAGASIILLVIILNIFEHNLVNPINKISRAASEYAFDTDAHQKFGTKRINELKIHSCVEVEELFNSLKKLSNDTSEYIDKIKMDAEEMTRLQEGIILVFADMVENRDKNTGDHIKKTSYYVKRIAEELKEEGVYSDVLNDEYIAKIVRSAPLHDVGKIIISDLILNKPGRLTVEEFELMKTHTTAGYEILSDVPMNTSSDSGYLDEAINMAHYHHEWWNGNGYPNGLKGEEIPLSARIMAVADVFDALVSKRSYKAAFPFDTAIDIIKSETGTHFDPKVARAFLNIAESFRDQTKPE